MAEDIDDHSRLRVNWSGRNEGNNGEEDEEKREILHVDNGAGTFFGDKNLIFCVNKFIVIFCFIKLNIKDKKGEGK